MITVCAPIASSIFASLEFGASLQHTAVESTTRTMLDPTRHSYDSLTRQCMTHYLLLELSFYKSST